jgi:hypothetical protein
MNPLAPELKRLMRWAKQAPPNSQDTIPPYFAARVVAHMSHQQPSLTALWQKAVWGSAWAAAAVILIGAALLTAQKLRPSSPYDFGVAYRVVSMELIP